MLQSAVDWRGTIAPTGPRSAVLHRLGPCRRMASRSPTPLDPAARRPMTKLFEAHGLVKRYGGRSVVNHVSFLCLCFFLFYYEYEGKPV